STFPGKLWIIMMFIFRIVVVARIGDMVYHDEQSHFVCNTLSPGCSNVCFNAFSPISQLRFWSLMVLVVSTPGILFCIYASHKIYHAYVKFPLANKQNKIMLENPQLYRAYWWHVVIRTILEVGFLVGQYYLYGWFVPELFECARWPCPKTVDCFVSRPMEKTCLLWLMFGLEPKLTQIPCLFNYIG
uniref:Gap junction protein n=1 Tax=Ciona savignyi TaxID=51511 RepID=H2Y5A5_CIOSA